MRKFQFKPEFAPEQLVPVLECGIERFLEEHNSKAEVDPTRPFQSNSTVRVPTLLNQEGGDSLSVRVSMGKISLLSDGMRYLKPISKVYGKVISRIRSGVSW